MKYVHRFPFFGPNRFADCPVMEWLVELEEAESKTLAERGPELHTQLLELLADCGLNEVETEALRGALPESPRERFAFLLAGTAVALQRHAGHAVDFVHWEAPEDRGWLRTVHEFEEDVTNVMAGDLSLWLLERVIPGLEARAEGFDPALDPADVVEEFRGEAEINVMPADARAIVRAAQRADVPCLRLDRWPFPLSERAIRVREHGALLLGQGARRHVVDGTLCLDRSERAQQLVADHLEVAGVLATLEAPSAFPDYRQQLEEMDGGEEATILVANGEALGFVRSGAEDDCGAVHPAITELACRAARELGVGLLTMTVIAPDFSRPLEDSGGAVADLNVAPRLDELLAPSSPLLDAAADAFIRWLFPSGTPARIPIVAVTGTNGKTTTTRMVASIMHEAGYNTGMACSDGMYIGSSMMQSTENEEYTRQMQHLMMADPRIDAAVLETYLGRMRSGGLAWDACDVAVLTNVTMEHLGLGGETVEQVADLKAAVLERARDGAVLNADDPLTGRVLPRVKAKRLALTSAQRGIEDIRREDAPGALLVAVEGKQGKQRIVLQDGAGRTDLMAVGDIPAALGGAARFNVENALQAAAAASLMGIDADVIRTALSEFKNEWENTRGRLNFFDGLPYRLLLDYAHNSDGMRKLVEVTDTLEVAGRRILMFAIHGERTGPEIAALAQAAAGHFDHYVCRGYLELRGRQPGEIAALLREQLIQAGVAEECITACDDAAGAVGVALGLAEPGDLLVMTHTQNEAPTMWARFESERAALENASPS